MRVFIGLVISLATIGAVSAQSLSEKNYRLWSLVTQYSATCGVDARYHQSRQTLEKLGVRAAVSQEQLDRQLAQLDMLAKNKLDTASCNKLTWALRDQIAQN